jgi:hypothetical protein
MELVDAFLKQTALVFVTSTIWFLRTSFWLGCIRVLFRFAK